MSKFVIISGMHRSGTSFLARAFNLMGMNLGGFEELTSDEWRPMKDNLRGHWENKQVLRLTEETLSQNNGSWSKIPTNISINEELSKKIELFIKHISSKPSLAFGFKDPRILLCLNEWRPYLPKSFVLIGIFRNPTSVAESLKKRNDFSYDISINLWKKYNEYLLQYLEKYGGYLLNFDWDKEKLFSEIKKIGKDLGLVTDIDLEKWYDDSIIHNKNTFEQTSFDDETKKLYSILTKLANDNKTISMKTALTTKELKEILSDSIITIKKQGDYFYEISSENINTIELLKQYSSHLEDEVKTKDAELTKTKEYSSHLEDEVKTKYAELTKTKEFSSHLEDEVKTKDAELTKTKEFSSHLEDEVKTKDAELTKTKEYSSHLEDEVKTKDAELTKTKEHTLKLSKELESNKEENLGLIEENNFKELKRKKYYMSRL